MWRAIEYKNGYNVLIVSLEEKSPHGVCRRRCEDNIKMDLKDIWYVGVYWIYVAQFKDK
jgi:hypothetical protein